MFWFWLIAGVTVVGAAGLGIFLRFSSPGFIVDLVKTIVIQLVKAFIFQLRPLTEAEKEQVRSGEGINQSPARKRDPTDHGR